MLHSPPGTRPPFQAGSNYFLCCKPTSLPYIGPTTPNLIPTLTVTQEKNGTSTGQNCQTVRP